MRTRLSAVLVVVFGIAVPSAAQAFSEAYRISAISCQNGGDMVLAGETPGASPGVCSVAEQGAGAALLCPIPNTQSHPLSSIANVYFDVDQLTPPSGTTGTIIAQLCVTYFSSTGGYCDPGYSAKTTSSGYTSLDVNPSGFWNTSSYEYDYGYAQVSFSYGGTLMGFGVQFN
jgi:hypothetical protein